MKLLTHPLKSAFVFNKNRGYNNARECRFEKYKSYFIKLLYRELSNYQPEIDNRPLSTQCNNFEFEKID